MSRSRLEAQLGKEVTAQIFAPPAPQQQGEGLSAKAAQAADQSAAAATSQAPASAEAIPGNDAPQEPSARVQLALPFSKAPSAAKPHNAFDPQAELDSGPDAAAAAVPPEQLAEEQQHKQIAKTATPAGTLVLANPQLVPPSKRRKFDQLPPDLASASTGKPGTHLAAGSTKGEPAGLEAPAAPGTLSSAGAGPAVVVQGPASSEANVGNDKGSKPSVAELSAEERQAQRRR